MQAHPVEAKAVHLVVGGPEHRRILDELAHHGVLGGGVAATAGAFHRAGGGVAPVVVAGHDAVEHRERAVRAFVGRVVVHHVHDDAQAHFVQGLVHGAHLQDAGGAGRIGGVAALRHVVEHRVVAPVEAVDVRQHVHDLARRRRGRVQSLQFLDNARGVAHVAGAEFLVGVVQAAQLVDGVAQVHLRRRIFVDGADVEGRQHMEVREAGVRQRFEVGHRRRAVRGEGEVLAAMFLRGAGVAGAEVAHMALVDDGRLRIAAFRRGVGVPAGGFQVRIVQIDELRSKRTGVRANGIRIPRFAHQHAAFARMVGGDDEAVELAIPVLGGAGGAPDAGVRVLAHGQVGAEGEAAVRAFVVDAQLHVLRGGRPHRAGDVATVVHRAEHGFVRAVLAGGVHAVKHLGELQLRAVLLALGVLADDPQLVGEQLLDAGELQIQGVGRVVRKVRRARPLRVGQLRRRERSGLGAANDHAALAAVRLVLAHDVQFAALRAVKRHLHEIAVPNDGVGVQPVRRLILDGQRRRLELLAHVVDAEGLRRGARLAQFVLRQGGIDHHPEGVAVGIGGILGEVDAQIHRLRRPVRTVDDEVAAHATFLQLQHPVDAVDGIGLAVLVVLIVGRRAVRPTGAGALVAVVHRAVRPAQRDALGIPATRFAAVVPQVQHPAIERLVAAVVVDDRFVWRRRVLGGGLVRHHATAVHDHFRRRALRRRGRPALAVRQHDVVAFADREGGLIAAGAASAASRKQGRERAQRRGGASSCQFPTHGFPLEQRAPFDHTRR